MSSGVRRRGTDAKQGVACCFGETYVAMQNILHLLVFKIGNEVGELLVPY
jgi:hypothetical protein